MIKFRGGERWGGEAAPGNGKGFPGMNAKTKVNPTQNLSH